MPVSINVRTVVQAHLFRERFDVLLTVITPFVIMLESGYGNAWAFLGGTFDFSAFNTWLALGRGIFLEALVFAMFRLVRFFVGKRTVGAVLVSIVPFLIGLVGMVVSAGCNLAWSSNSGEMVHLLALLSQFFPPFVVAVFKVGLGLLFPIALGAFALFDLKHIVVELLNSSSLDNQALHVHKAETHRNNFVKEQKRAADSVKDEYRAICEADAKNMVARARSGDLSFGSDDYKDSSAGGGIRKVTPVMPAGPAAGGFLPPAAGSMAGFPPMQQLPQGQPSKSVLGSFFGGGRP
jgi:hypothetical protein